MRTLLVLFYGFCASITIRLRTPYFGIPASQLCSSERSTRTVKLHFQGSFKEAQRRAPSRIGSDIIQSSVACDLSKQVDVVNEKIELSAWDFYCGTRTTQSGG